MTKEYTGKVEVTQGGRKLPGVGSIVRVTYENGETMERLIVRTRNREGKGVYGFANLKGNIALKVHSLTFRTIIQLVEAYDNEFPGRWEVLDVELSDILYNSNHI